MAIDYSKHEVVINQLGIDQEPELDNRQNVSENRSFLSDKDGQWEQSISEKFRDQPQYTFDMTNPIVNSIAGELNSTDFSVRIRPAGGEATQDIAETLDGLIRNIENMSNATHIYKKATKNMIGTGLDGWEVVHDYAEGDSYDQDLLIKAIPDYANRVWFDTSAELPDQSDADHVFVLQQMSHEKYNDNWPEGSKESIKVETSNHTSYYSPDLMTVGRIQWKKPINKILVRMNDGSVYVKDEKFKKVEDDLKLKGIVVDKERVKKTYVVCSRLFDGGGWLGKEYTTAFKHLPVIPMMANFNIANGKITYHSAIQTVMDRQRVYNYGKSREVSDVALSPRPKYWLTDTQMSDPNHTATMATLNENTDPIQGYTNDPEVPGPPMQTGGNTINPALITLNQSMPQEMQMGAGLYGINQGDVGGNAMSGVAIQSLQNKGDNGTLEYYDVRDIAMTATGRVLLGAIPTVYDAARMIRIIGEDGAEEMVKINETVTDGETGEPVQLNDLTIGQYDATCSVGPAFKNRQQETVKAFNELAAVIPGLAEITADIQMSNIPTPGMDKAAARIRKRLLDQGVIPEDQMTKEEIEEQQILQQQPKELTPDEKIAAAEEARVQAETADVISKTQERSQKGELAELTLILKQQDQQRQTQNDQVSAMVQGMQAAIDGLNKNADTALKLKDLSGASSIVTPDLAIAMENQIDLVTEQQEIIDEDFDQFITGTPTDEIIRMLTNGG